MYPSIQVLRRDVARRLRRGEHMVLYGAHGAGKTTLLLELEARIRNAGIACALAAHTRSLDDITRALEAAHPSGGSEEAAVDIVLARRWSAADLQGSVLILDHLTDVTNAMLKLLRRFHGGVMGVVSAVDDEVERVNPRLRPWRMGALSIRMPAASWEQLHHLLQQRSADLHLPRLDTDVERQLIGAAQGRPGWILECVQRQTLAQYWQGSQLFVSLLCTDTETALQQDLLASCPNHELA